MADRRKVPEGFSCKKLHTGPVSPSGQCIPCRREKEKRSRQTPSRKAKIARAQRVRNNRLKQRCFEAYGGAFCACCKVEGLVFLTLDHLGNNGGIHRREMQSVSRSLGSGWLFYRDLERQGFPPGYQVLCWNCNAAKHLLGICPHQGEPPPGFLTPDETRRLSKVG